MNEIEKQLAKIQQWQETHQVEDDVRHHETVNKLATLPTKEEIEVIVRQIFFEGLSSAGRVTRTGLTFIILVFTAIGLITGGFKYILGLLGLVISNKS